MISYNQPLEHVNLNQWLNIRIYNNNLHSYHKVAILV